MWIPRTLTEEAADALEGLRDAKVFSFIHGFTIVVQGVFVQFFPHPSKAAPLTLEQWAVCSWWWVRHRTTIHCRS